MHAFTQTYPIFFGGFNRDYIVHLPAGYVSTNQYPVVFNLHGYTSDAVQQVFYTQMNSTADANNFIVVYPNGIANAWNSGFVGTYGTGIDDVGFISAIIDSLNKNLSINLNRVYSCGMSNGGFQSYRLACELSNRIAAIASVTGSMTDSTFFYCNPSRPVPTMEVHGTADATVNYNGGFGFKAIDDVVQFWKTKNSCTASVETTAVANTNTTDGCTADFIQVKGCSLGIENWLYKVYGGGHTWPGSPVNIIGSNTSLDFNASQRIWDFFNMYTLAGATNVSSVEPAVEVRLYPNPAYTNIKLISSELFSDASLTIIDVLGQVKFRSDINSSASEVDLDVSQLAAGNYYVKIIQAGSITVNKKIAIIH